MPRTAIWPRRNRPGLPMATFARSIAEAHRLLMAAPPPPPKPDGLVGIITNAINFCRAVGLPELWSRAENPKPKGSTLIELDDTARGLVLRVIHRVSHSKQRLEAAADALANIMEIMGREVRFREIGHAPNMGGWQAVLRIAPVIARPALAMVK